jgi:16S rRNA (guanine(527)-N(7))-methyltransferase RsmG
LFEDNDKDFYLFKDQINPSNDTIYKLKIFVSMLLDHQKNMNLIGESTMSTIWKRHILDSAQIEKILPKENKNYITVDVGTGAGFPGIVLAVMGRKDLLLCEKSTKKNMFLNAVAQECNLKVKMYNDRIENLKAANIRTIIARAFAPLKNLIFKVRHCLNDETTLVLHKGRTYMKEIIEAKSLFCFNYKCYDSATNSDAKILKIDNIQEKNA